jgi:hypothetical protein
LSTLAAGLLAVMAASVVVLAMVNLEYAWGAMRAQVAS